MKKPVINFEECIGCGSCSEICPEVFEVSDDAKAYVTGEDKCGTCDCQEAADICPTEAISFEE
jgi:ferredoxin